jgi:hypothetical protein
MIASVSRARGAADFKRQILFSKMIRLACKKTLQILGAVSGFNKAMIVAKLKGAFVEDHADTASTSKLHPCRSHRASGNDVVSAPTDGRAKKSVLAKCAVAFVEDHADAASASKAASCRRHRACGNDVVSAPMVARAPDPPGFDVAAVDRLCGSYSS